MLEETYMFGSKEKISQQKLIFNELSTMLIKFKQILMAMHKSFLYFQQTQALLMEENLKIIESTSSDIFHLIDLPTSWINSPFKSDNNKTYCRFIGRLLESLTSLKQKVIESAGCNRIFSYLKDMQKILSKFNESSSLPKVLRQIYAVIRSYCENLRNGSDQNGIKKDENKVGLEQQKRMQKGFYLETQKQRKAKMDLQSLNKTFNTMKCLDIDYAHYRSTYFDAKNNELYEDYFDRNRRIGSTVQLYSKGFKEYLIRKQRKKNDRNRLNMFKRTKAIEESFSVKKQKSFYNHRIFKKRSIEGIHQTEKSMKQKSLTETNKIERREREGKKGEIKKEFYKMNNIMIAEKGEENRKNAIPFQFKYESKSNKKGYIRTYKNVSK